MAMTDGEDQFRKFLADAHECLTRMSVPDFPNASNRLEQRLHAFCEISAAAHGRESQLRKQVAALESTLAAAKAELADVKLELVTTRNVAAADNARLTAVIANDCENEEACRAALAKALGAEAVNGDTVCRPPIVELIERLAGELERVRGERDGELPHRQYTLRIKVGGDEWSDVMSVFNELSRAVEDRGVECQAVIGGGRSGGFVEVSHDPAMTHAKYMAAIEDYRLAQAAAEGGRDA